MAELVAVPPVADDQAAFFQHFQAFGLCLAEPTPFFGDFLILCLLCIRQGRYRLLIRFFD